MSISMINKNTIHDFIDEFEEDKDYKRLNQLRDLSVSLWKHDCEFYRLLSVIKMEYIFHSKNKFTLNKNYSFIDILRCFRYKYS